jgi:hypothetical protein|tara:strand:- start:767 stop:1681 length:915 start_codon:yes stop_codon:yes gene_type:complete
VTTKHEISATVDAQNWLSTLPREIQIKTLSTQILKEHWLTKNSSALSMALIDCFKQKAWEKVAYMPSVKSKREIKEYKRAVEWIRDCLKVEPDELIRVITGHQASAKTGSEAVTFLVETVAKEEPGSLKQLCNDFSLGKSKMIGWEKLLGIMKEIDPEWQKAHDRLKELMQRENLEKLNANSYRQNNLFEIKNIENQSKSKKNYLPKDKRSKLIRSLEKLKNRPLLCKSRGTTPERVSETLNRFLRGLIPTVEMAKKEAGLVNKKSVGGIGIRGNSTVVAKRIIKTIGKESALKLANQIMEVLK